VEFIDRAIKKQNFDLIMTTDGEKSFYHEELINAYYFLDKKDNRNHALLRRKLENSPSAAASQIRHCVIAPLREGVAE
jgi:hypothetical protein